MELNKRREEREKKKKPNQPDMAERENRISVATLSPAEAMEKKIHS